MGNILGRNLTTGEADGLPDELPEFPQNSLSVRRVKKGFNKHAYQTAYLSSFASI